MLQSVRGVCIAVCAVAFVWFVLKFVLEASKEW